MNKELLNKVEELEIEYDLEIADWLGRDINKDSLEVLDNDLLYLISNLAYMTLNGEATAEETKLYEEALEIYIQLPTDRHNISLR